MLFRSIIEEFATVVAIRHDRENIDFTLTCSFTGELKIDQSVAHNGVCLTVVSIEGDNYVVTAMKETLDRSNLGLLKVGDKVNVERSMLMNGRLDGHIVQGHVDQTARCIAKEDAGGSTTSPSAMISMLRKRATDTSPSTRAQSPSTVSR